MLQATEALLSRKAVAFELCLSGERCDSLITLACQQNHDKVKNIELYLPADHRFWEQWEADLPLTPESFRAQLKPFYGAETCKDRCAVFIRLPKADPTSDLDYCEPVN